MYWKQWLVFGLALEAVDRPLQAAARKSVGLLGYSGGARYYSEYYSV